MRELVEKEVLICHTLFGHSPQESQERRKSKSRGGMYQTATLINPSPPGNEVPSLSRKLDSALRWRHVRGLHNWERERGFQENEMCNLAQIRGDVSATARQILHSQVSSMDASLALKVGLRSSG
jgi:hypothetical protein